MSREADGSRLQQAATVKGIPEISEDGRRFLLDRLHRLTPAHVRAVFTAARVDRLDRSRTARSDDDGLTAIDEWVAAFEDKVRQIDSRRCVPITPGPMGH